MVDGLKYMKKILFKRLLYLVFITKRAIYGWIKCKCYEILRRDYEAGARKILSHVMKLDVKRPLKIGCELIGRPLIISR